MDGANIDVEGVPPFLLVLMTRGSMHRGESVDLVRPRRGQKLRQRARLPEVDAYMPKVAMGHPPGFSLTRDAHNREPAMQEQL
jgi:hypothetical protein